MRKSIAAGLGVCLLALSACGDDGATSDGGNGDAAPEYPTDQITFVSPFDVGGGIDLAINTIMQTLQESDLAVTDMRLTNIPGGSGQVAAAELAADHSGADDIMMVATPSFLGASLQETENVGIDDLTPIAGLFAEYSYVYVGADSPFQSFDDVVAAVEADPAGVVIGGGSVGSTDSLVVAALAQSLGYGFDEMTYLPLPGDESAANLLGGQTDVAVGGPDLLPLVEAGDARVLAVSAPEPLSGEQVADIPTLVDLGYDITATNWRGLFGPPEMPDYAVDYWSDTLTELFETEEWQQAAEQNVWDTLGMSTEEFTQFLQEQEEFVGQAFTEMGLLE